MASSTDTADVLAIPYTGKTVSELVSVRADALLVSYRSFDVSSVHNSATPGTSYLVCGCCEIPGFPCRLVPCTNCQDGYGPYQFNAGMFKDSSSTDMVNNAYLELTTGAGFTINIPILIFYSSLFPTDDCEWSGSYLWYVVSPGTFTEYTIYLRLYYDTTWKLDVDISNLYGPPYAPLGATTTIDLGNTLKCFKTETGLTGLISSGPPAPYSSRLLDYYGNELTDAYFLFQSCGTPLATTACCTEKTPKYLYVTCACVDVNGINFQYNAGKWYSQLGVDYLLELSCVSGNWHLKAYTGTTTGGTVVYDSDAASSICYPFYASFTGITLTGYCGSAAFDIELSA